MSADSQVLERVAVTGNTSLATQGQGIAEASAEVSLAFGQRAFASPH